MPMLIGILGCGWLGLPLAAHLVEGGQAVNGSTTHSDRLATIRQVGARPFLVRIGPPVQADPPPFFEVEVLFLNIPPGRRDPDRLARYPEVVGAAADAAAEFGVRWIIFASSTSVYPDLSRVVTEADAGGVPDGSGAVLLKAEVTLQNDLRFDTTILRFAGLYGYDRQPGRFLSGTRALTGGGAPVNLVHRDDAVSASALIIERNLRGRVFNICADAHPSRVAFYTAKALELGLPPPEFDDLEMLPFKIVDNSSLKRAAEFTYRYPDPVEAAP